MKKRLLAVLLLCLFNTISCKNEINIQLDDVGIKPEPGQVAGKIMLPAGTTMDTTGLEVLTATHSRKPLRSTYAIDTTGKTSTTLLLNKAGDVVLMGYTYPGQTEGNLSVESTALAFLMNTLTMQSLSLKGRLKMIPKIKADPGFGKLAGEIALSLKAGISVTDTTNTELIKALAAPIMDQPI